VAWIKTITNCAFLESDFPRSSLVAQLGWGGKGRAIPHCPGRSDVDLFDYGESIIGLNAEIPDGALDLGMSQQQLHGT